MNVRKKISETEKYRNTIILTKHHPDLKRILSNSQTFFPTGTKPIILPIGLFFTISPSPVGLIADSGFSKQPVPDRGTGRTHRMARTNERK